jgi:hypothetical protein
MKNEVYLDFTIADFDDIDHEEITRQLGISPKEIYVKGEKRNPDSPVGTLIRRNRWIMGSSLNEHATFEDQMNALLDIIEPRIDLFRPFCDKYYCGFSCAIFIRYDNDEGTPWVHLDKRYNKLLKELDIEFDLDLYCLPNREDD